MRHGKKLMRTVLLSALLTAVVFATSAFAAKVTATSTAAVRRGASTKTTLLTTMPKGVSRTVLGVSGKWYKIKMNGKTGYVHGARVRPTEPRVGAEADAPADDWNDSQNAANYVGTAAKKTFIYGSSNGKYTARAAAEANMVTISVRVWDFANGQSGTKITKTLSLRIHRKLAPTVKKIFEEIYNGDEKAPIYAVGGYDWRGGNISSEHSQGTAIDLNPEYNYFVSKDGKNVYFDGVWNPKKYAYSIPRNGDIEKAFRKYGFARGDWRTKIDYMHFSYFGT